MNRSLAFPLAAAITASVFAQSPTNGIVRLEPALDAVVPASAKTELLKGDGLWRIRVNIAGIRPVTKEKR